MQKDIFDLTKEELKGFDVVVDAAGAWLLETLYVIPKAAITLADLVKGTDTRLVVVGGAGSLYTNAGIPLRWSSSRRIFRTHSRASRWGIFRFLPGKSSRIGESMLE